MRKIKITALILAVLMVMAAFAGCASKSTVEDLDDRVSALEGKIDANQKANEESISELADLIAALTQSQTNIKDSVDANKAAQDASNKAILDAIKDLTNKVTEVEKEQDTTVKVDAALTALKQEKSKLIAGLKATYEAKKANYTEEDYAAIVTILSAADIDINAAATTAAVNELYAAMEKALAKYAQVDDYIYAQVKAYQGNITPASEAAVKALKKYLDETAKEVYGAAYATNAKLTAYVYGEDEDGEDLTINLVAWVNFLYNLQTGNKVSTYQDPATGDVVRTLAYVVDTAKALVNDIALLGTVKLENTTALDAAIDAYYNENTGWAVYAEYLSKDNLALVSNAAVLEAAKARLQVLTDATIAFGKLGKYDTASKSYTSVFAAWLALDDELLYTNKKVYDAINAKLDAWIKEYKLEAENVAYILANSTLGITNYADTQPTVELSARALSYVSANAYVNAMAEAAKAFKADIAPRILAMNEIKTLDTAAFEEYAAISKAIEKWAVRAEDDTTTTDVNEKILVNAANQLAIVNDTLELELTAINGVVDLYTFEVAGVATFFETTYAAAARAAKGIATQLNAINLATITNIVPFITIAGDMNVASGVYTYKTAAELEALTETNTIAGFTNVYVVDEGDLKYDLTVLLPTAEFEAKKAQAVKIIADRKAEALNIAKAWATYLTVVDNTFTATEELYAQYGITLDITATTTLAHKADLDAVVTLYTNWVKAGGSVAMKELALKENSTTEYELKAILDPAIITALNTHKGEMANLGTWATNQVNIFKALTTINNGNAFSYKYVADNYLNYKTDKVTYTAQDATTMQNKEYTSYKYSYYKETNNVGNYNYKWESKTGYLTSTSNWYKQNQFFSNQYCDQLDDTATKTAAAGALKVNAAIANAETNYNAFVAANGYQTYAPVEEAKAANNFDAYVFTCVKNVVYKMTTAADASATNAAVDAATTLDQLATALVSYFAAVPVAEATTKTVAFNNVTYITAVLAPGADPVVTVR